VATLFIHAGKEGVMVKTTLALVCVLCVGLAAPLGARDDSFLRFDGGIGVIPASSVANPNAVRGVPPPGQIWVISALKANIDRSGHITARGRGLLLGGGNNIGTNGNQSVRATLICDLPITNQPPPTQFSTANVVPLDANGDFRIDDDLRDPAGMFTDACASPVLLIRPGGNAWFAAGILKLDDHN
jgi:hypothetical protein